MRDDGGSNRNNNIKNVYSYNNHIMLCSAKEFPKEQKKNGYCLAIFPKEVQEDEKEIFVPTEIQRMLEDFK